MIVRMMAVKEAYSDIYISKHGMRFRNSQLPHTAICIGSGADEGRFPV